MIAKGVAHAQGARLARYLITGKERERAELLELRGFALTDIVDAFRSVQVAARATKCVQPFFHVSVRNPQGEKLDATQWTRTADAIEQSFGLADQPRAIAFHICEETGQSHMHVAWSRIDEDSLRAKPLPFFKERLKRVCRELEAQFRLTKVPSARTGRIGFAPTRNEEEQSRRLGVDLRDQREVIRECFEHSDCGRSFQRALEEQGVVIAKGERRDFIAVDRRSGGIHALGKRILGMSAAQIRVRFADLKGEDLPTVEEARRSLRSKRTETLAVAPEPAAQTSAAEGVSEIEPVRQNVKPAAEAEIPPAQFVEEPTSDIDVAPSRTRPRGFASLKLRLRAAAKALFRRSSPPKPQAGGRKKGEVVGAFRLAARRLLRPVVRIPIIANAVGFLNEALPWLHLWEWNDTGQHAMTAGSLDRHDDHWSPHP